MRRKETFKNSRHIGLKEGSAAREGDRERGGSSRAVGIHPAQLRVLADSKVTLRNPRKEMSQ